ncbi:ornithine cyclodeaminase family protein [Marinobacterium arenosum]|uniref:ornithine cyclodeaminase family protein n=1 Tax=Marinobacterium arenosum TaxID=2862496 RepID=UPI001C989BB8|nr:ornithine cyclodeaminase family protein [Marinobacterium arenosum]MBY4675627.1 ornithine cyclodeaminase family protein [Marinobacterium arenosum]
MRIIDAQQVAGVMAFDGLIGALREAFAGSFGMPQRQLYPLDPQHGHGDAFAVLPAWNEQLVGVKAFTYYPDNPARGLPTLASKILLFKRDSGAPLALVDGTEVTYWRTAAASALAADYLARPDTRRLLLCGTGKLAPYMALAHAQVRGIDEVMIWGRDAEKAKLTLQQIQARRPGLRCRLVEDLPAATAEADIISCATGAAVPLILGDWVQPGCHVDLVGNHAADRRECDSTLVERSRVFVDSRSNVLNEAGELLIPIAEGRFSVAGVAAELAELCAGRRAGRQSDNEITLYKSVGTALADLAAAHWVVRQLAE